MLTVRRGQAVLFQGEDQSGTLMEALRARGVPVSFPCAGRGRCGLCRVRLVAGDVQVQEAERQLIGEAALKDGVRLACCLPAAGIDVALDERAAAVLTDFSLREGAPSEGAGGEGLGVAVDIGTTTLAAFLVDRATGAVLERRGELSAQRPYGADVMTRMQHALEAPGGAVQLRDAARGQIGGLIDALCRASGRDRRDIAAVSIAANTVMVHLLLGLPVDTLATIPFEPVTLDALTLPAADWFAGLMPGAVVLIAPGASAFVGGDIVAGVTECAMDEPGGVRMLIDIGTNGEIVLAQGGALSCCATAAGPAFEHGRLGYGSDVVKKMAELLRGGVMDETGAMAAEAFELDDGVFVTRRDVRNLQLAKAAIAAGIQAMLGHAGLSAEQVDEIYLAGAFGNALNLDDALRIGLLPRAFRGRIRSVGNTAGAGAVRMLLGRARMTRMADAARRMRAVELSTDPIFLEAFVEEMLFPEE